MLSWLSLKARAIFGQVSWNRVAVTQKFITRRLFQKSKNLTRFPISEPFCESFRQ